ncbi:MAG TPA: NfeD family protein, partial [Chthoniobacteraceae bacterium]
MKDKEISMLSAVARSAAQKNGHNPELAEAFIRKEKEVKIGETVVDAGDSLLTLSAEEAARGYDGRPLLAVQVTPSLEDLARHAGLTGTITRIQPSGFERVAFWITTLAPLFLLGGILGGYIEFKTPGFGVPGILSIICFGIFFTGHFLAGLSGWETAFFFGLGIALLLAELLLFPGMILPGTAGAVLVVGSLIYAMVDRYPSQPVVPDSAMLVRPLANLVIAIGLTVVAGLVLARYLPRTAFYNRIVLGAAIPSGPAVTAPISLLQIALGETGTARTVLRPSGKADFGGRLYDVVSEGGMIDAGEPVRVRHIEGLKVVVEQA